VRVPAALAEQARARLLELAPRGFEEVERGDELELAAYTDPAGEERLRAAFVDVLSSPVAPGWEDGWRAFHRPVRAGGIWIGPPWEPPPPGEPVVVIDPGRAFGTGAHPTTRLCVELLARAPRGSLLDVGCGSGVLSLAADRLGYGPIVAVDDDPVAVEATRANAAANGVDLVARVVDASRETLPVSDVAVANILLGAVEDVLGRLESRTVITSGYYAGERPASPGWSWLEGLELGGWCADMFRCASV